LAVTNEYRHQTLTPTFLAEPRRGVVLGAKLLAALPMGLAFALACQLTSVAVGGAVFGATGFPTALGLAHTWALLARGLVAMTLWTVVGVGYGTLLHNQLAAILVLVGFTQFIEPVLRMIPTLLNTDWPVLRYLPGAASDAVVGTSFYNVSFYAGRAASGLANPWVGAVTLIGYGVVLGAIGYWASLRKDVT
jgi:ABC-type transport system involved in multi-copper enzyme maturation permease subunit